MVDKDNGFSLLLLFSKERLQKDVRLMEAERLHDDFDRSYEVNVNLCFNLFCFFFLMDLEISSSRS